MIIQRLDIDGFGIWRGLRLSRLGQPLTVFYGPNEAGKTTVMQFIRSMLYGLSDERRERYFPPVQGGPAGGALHVTTPHGTLEISRHWDPADGGAGTASGRLRITSAHDTLEPETLLSTVVGGIDETIFNNIYALGLREMQELATLDDTHAAERLYRLSTGLDRISLVETLRGLSTAKQRIAARSGRSSRTQQLLARRDKLQREIDELRQQTSNYDRLGQQHRELGEKLAAAQEEQSGLERQLRMIDAARAVREKWRRRDELDSLLALTANKPLPPGAVDKLAQLDTSIDKRRQALMIAKRRYDELDAEASRLPRRENVERQVARVAALVEHRPWILTLEEQQRDIEAQRSAVERELQEARSALGPHSVGERSGQFDSAAQRRLRPLARAQRAARQEWKRAKIAAQTTEKAAAALAAELRLSLARDGEPGLTFAMERAGKLVTQLRNRTQLDKRIDELTRQRKELNAENNELVDRQLTPARTLTALGIAFVLGAVMVLAGLFLPWVGTLGWVLVVVGAGGAAAAYGGNRWLENSAEKRLHTCRRQLEAIEQELEDCEDQRETLDSQLPKGGGPLLQRLAVAEKELNQLEALVDIDRRRQTAQEKAKHDADLAEAAGKQARVARRRWQEALAAAGLSPDMTGGKIRALAETSSRVQQLQERLAKLSEQGKRLREQLDSLAGRIAPLVLEMGLASAGLALIAQIEQLERTLAEHQRLSARRKELDRELRETRQRGKLLGKRLKQAMNRRQALFRAAGVSKASEFRRQALQEAQRELQRRELATLNDDITATLGADIRADALAEVLRRVPAFRLEEHGRALAERLEAVRRRVHDALEGRGRVQEQLRAAAADRRLGAKLVELGTIDRQIADAGERWQTLSVAHAAIEMVRRQYEADRQPAALEDASRRLNRLTRGAYRRVWTPLDVEELRVDDAHGASLRVDVLSRGTREQLFLALRLALVASYSRSGIEMPLVLDDVLVNFDGPRIHAAAEVLWDFAQDGHQVLMFTCHEHIARAFAAVGAVTRQIDGEAPLKFNDPATRALPSTIVESPPSPFPLPQAAPTPVRLDAEPPLWTTPLEPMPSLPKRRRRRRARLRRRGDVFAGTIWHDPVQDDAARSHSMIELDDGVYDGPDDELVTEPAHDDGYPLHEADHDAA